MCTPADDEKPKLLPVDEVERLGSVSLAVKVVMAKLDMID